MKFRTLNYRLKRVQPLSAVIKYLKAFDRELDRFGEYIGAESVVVVEKVVKQAQPIDDSLMDVLRRIRPDILGLKYVNDYGRRAVVIFFKDSVLSVDWTNLDTGGTIRKILQEVLAA